MNEKLQNKVVLTVATTGAVTTRDSTPFVPLHPEEIAKEVQLAYEAGASIAHIHVRDDGGNASMNINKYMETVGLIREKNDDIVLNLTTSGSVEKLSYDERIEPFKKLLPEMASFDAGTMNWLNQTIFENHPKFLEQLGRAMQEVNVKPEIEVFDAGMLYTALYLQKKGFLPEGSLHFQFVLGAPGGIAATVENLVFLKSLLPENATWSAFGIGKMAVPIMMTTLALGGHLRVGMEDNVYLKKGQLARSNVEFVEQAKRLIRELGKEIATPEEARQLLNLTKKA
ncbi:3-keto-5-aminohexanoate cleavage protein [Amphibacillus sp. Q70]|uniref:3-keto-5-aminohexanoate cleavage protein n=1 Tax=Amphibacillus sp. Q70 TaxID=3453416 RepID=UPI003F852E39